MLWKLMTVVAALIAFVEAVHFEYPQTKSCILADIDMNSTLTRTVGNKTESAPMYSLDGANVTSGKCGISTRTLLLKLAVDSATIQFSFMNNTGSVSMTMLFGFNPSKVWKGGSNNSVNMAASLDIGHTEKSYRCNSSQIVKFETTKDNVTYKAAWTMMNIQIQAFDVENNTYSEAEECSQDFSTAKPTTATTEPTSGTTEHTNGTTEHSNITTQHTTEPTNITTEPTNHTTEHTIITSPSTAPPMTTVPPAPPASHPTNQYTFNASDGHSKCVLLKAQILFKIPYPNGSKPAEVGIPDLKDVDVSGDCNYTGKNLDMMEIQFRKTWSLQWVFSNSKVPKMLSADDTSSFWWKEVTLNYTYEKALFPGLNASLVGTWNVVTTNFSGNEQFKADMDGSYMCNADTTVDIGGGVKMETWDLQYFAFENQTKFNTDDNKISQCSADAKTNSIVPIAVGAALAGLVVIVLIAYLIGRRRNRKGYESV